MRSMKPLLTRGVVSIIELLVALGILTLLTAIIYPSIQQSRERGKLGQLQNQIHQLQVALSAFVSDTGQFPSVCFATSPSTYCTKTSDPLLNSLGIGGWKGPYMTEWDLADPWGGHIALTTLNYNFTGVLGDINNDGKKDVFILIDDAAPSRGSNDHSGPIPLTTLKLIDKTFDDGNLNTGMMRGNGTGDASHFYTEANEIIWIITPS